MGVGNGSQATGAVVVQVKCNFSNDDHSQEWRDPPPGSPDGLHFLWKNGHSGKCLAIAGQSMQAGAWAEQVPCNGTFADHSQVLEMHETIGPHGELEFGFKNGHSGLCLSVSDQGVDSPIFQSKCAESTHPQLWAVAN